MTSERLRRLALSIAAPAARAALRAGRDVRDPRGERARSAPGVPVDVGLRHHRDQPGQHDQPVDHVLPRGGGGRDRLPDEPLQHRGRRAVPHRRAVRGRGGRRAPPASDPQRGGDPARRDDRGGRLGGDRRSAQGTSWGQRGHLDDHAELHRDRGDRLPADARSARGGGDRQQQHRDPADPAGGTGPGLLVRQRRRQDRGSDHPRRGRRRPGTGSCWAGPASGSTCGRRGRPSPQRSQAA